MVLRSQNFNGLLIVSQAKVKNYQSINLQIERKRKNVMIALMETSEHSHNVWSYES